ncbi:unnamed protein product [Peniophora sp. CBMAI 1063]|nr:unnamed protein product [Peniophora sp. CBMAI 1063]
MDANVSGSTSHLNIPSGADCGSFVQRMAVRLATIVSFFPDGYKDIGVLACIGSELEIVLAYIGHWRLIAGTTGLSESTLPGSFLLELQNTLDSERGLHFHLIAAAKQLLTSVTENSELPDPPFKRWWLHIPKDGPPPAGWKPFNLGMEIIREALTAVLQFITSLPEDQY